MGRDGHGRTVEVTAIDTIAVSGTLENGAIASAYIGSPPQLGTGFRMEIVGRDGVLLVTSTGGPNTNSLRIQGGRAGDDKLDDIPIDVGDIWTPDDVPQGAPFHVAQSTAASARALRGRKWSSRTSTRRSACTSCSTRCSGRRTLVNGSLSPGRRGSVRETLRQDQGERSWSSQG